MRSPCLRAIRLGVVITALAAVTTGCTFSVPDTGSRPAPPPTTLPPTVQSSVVHWTLPAPVSREVVLSNGGNLLMLGGLNSADTSTDAVYSIDPQTGAASRSAQLAHAVHDAAGGILGGTVYVFGGGSASVNSSVQALQAGSQSATVVANLPQPRADLAATVVGGRAYVVGGYDGSELLPGVLGTSDGTSFQLVGQLLQPVRYPAVAALGHDLYIFGGEESGGETAGLPTSDIQQLNLDTGITQVVGQLPVPLGHAGAAVIGGQILVIGGRTEAGVTASLLRFDPATGSVSNVGTLPYPVADFGSASVGDVVYLLGGEGPQTLSSVIAVQAARSATAGQGPKR